MEEVNTSATTLIENHSTIHKTDLESTAMVNSNSISDSPKNDILVPLNGNELSHAESLNGKIFEDDRHVSANDMVNGKNLEINDVHKVKESDMELDESSKDSKMDVESLSKDDVMDVDLEDHMDVDNNEGLNQTGVTNEDDSGAVNEKSKEESSANEGEELDDKEKETNGDEISRVNAIVEKVERDEKPESLEKTESEKALNSDDNESVINDVASVPENSEAEVLEPSFRNEESDPLSLLEDPLHQESSENNIVQENKEENRNVPDSQESIIDSLFSNSEKTVPSSQDINVTESLINLSQHVIEDLNNEEINLDLNCSERTDPIITGNVPESVVNENPSESEAVLNDELDGERLLDDLINFNDKESDEIDQNTALVLDGKESDEIDRNTSLVLDDKESNEIDQNTALVLDGFDSIKATSSENLVVEKSLRSEMPSEGEDRATLNKLTNENKDGASHFQDADKAISTEEINDILGLEKEKPAEEMDVEEGKATPDESMDVDFEENDDVEMHALPEVKSDASNSSKQNVSSSNEQIENIPETDTNVTEDSPSKVTGSGDVCANTVSSTSENKDGTEQPSSTVKDIETTDISELVSELDELFNSPKSSHHDSSADTIIDGESPKENNEAEDATFGILEATSIPPTEFDNMESMVEDTGKDHSSVLNLSELAQNVLNEKTQKKVINVKTIKQEKLDFSIKEEMTDESYDQITFENIDIKPNISGSNEKVSNNKKKKRKKVASLTQHKQRMRNKRKRLAQEVAAAEGQKTNDVKKKKKVDDAKKVTPGKQKKSPFPVINLTDKNAQLNKNSTAVKRSRASLNSVPVSLNNSSTPIAKKPRLSLPNFRNRVTRTGGKRLLRSAGEISEKIQDIVNDKSPNKSNKKPLQQVARKSTTQVKFRDVARKRGKPYVRPAQREPEPIFVDTNFGGQDMDMFINENDDEDSMTYYDASSSSRRSNRHAHPKSKEVKRKLRPCEVVIQRMPVIDRLLPAKKEPEKLEPNICELCDPKRIFLSKSSLAEHIKLEHLKNSADTTVLAPIEMSMSGRKEPDEVKACGFCKKPFHSKNRLLAHMKICKVEEGTKKLINNIPGIDLSNINKSVTISYSKKNEGTAPNTNHVCKVCNRKFLMATGLKSHMKTHKTSAPSKSNTQNPELDPLQIDISDSAGPDDAAFSVITKPKRKSKNLVMKFRREKGRESPGTSESPLKTIECVKIPSAPTPVKDSPQGKRSRSRKSAIILRAESPEIEILEEKITGCSFTTPVSSGTATSSGSRKSGSSKKKQKNDKNTNVAETKPQITPKTRTSSRKK